jgi:hypothetical protein
VYHALIQSVNRKGTTMEYLSDSIVSRQVQFRIAKGFGTFFAANFTIAFLCLGVSGQSYTIQWNDDLATNNWAFYTNFIGSGAVFQFQIPVMAIPPQNFFRVREP